MNITTFKAFDFWITFISTTFCCLISHHYMQSWARFEPPKTTVKRMLLHEDGELTANQSLFTDDKQDLTPQFQKGPEVARSPLSNVSAASNRGKSHFWITYNFFWSLCFTNNKKLNDYFLLLGPS